MKEMPANSAIPQIFTASSNVASLRTAFAVWGVASATTLIALLLAMAGNAAERLHLDVFSAGFIIAVGCIKAGLILRFYLGLGAAAGGWRAIFVAFLIVIFLGVIAAQGIVILMMP